MASWGLESGYFKCPAPRSQGLVQKGPDGVLRWFGGVWMHSRGPSSACGLLARAAVCCSEPFPSYPSCLRESTEQLASFPREPPRRRRAPHFRPNLCRGWGGILGVGGPGRKRELEWGWGRLMQEGGGM